MMTPSATALSFRGATRIREPWFPFKSQISCDGVGSWRATGVLPESDPDGQALGKRGNGSCGNERAADDRDKCRAKTVGMARRGGHDHDLEHGLRPGSGVDADGRCELQHRTQFCRRLQPHRSRDEPRPTLTATFRVQLTADATWNDATNASAAINATGGTGGIFIDNMATAGGSQVYYSTRSAAGVPGIAVQASQAGLN